MNRIKASSTRQRHGVRVACHRFFSRRGLGPPVGSLRASGLRRKRQLRSAAAVQDLAENGWFMGRGKPPDAVGASVAGLARSARAHPDTVVGGVIRAVAADVSPWQGSAHPANCHRLTSAATGLRPSSDNRHDEKMRPVRSGRLRPVGSSRARRGERRAKILRFFCKHRPLARELLVHEGTYPRDRRDAGQAEEGGTPSPGDDASDVAICPAALGRAMTILIGAVRAGLVRCSEDKTTKQQNNKHDMSTKKAPAKKAPASTAKAKDLPAKKDAKGGLKGGGWTETNHNETLLGDTAR